MKLSYCTIFFLQDHLLTFYRNFVFQVSLSFVNSLIYGCFTVILRSKMYVIIIDIRLMGTGSSRLAC